MDEITADFSHVRHYIVVIIISMASFVYYMIPPPELYEDYYKTPAPPPTIFKVGEVGSFSDDDLHPYGKYCYGMAFTQIYSRLFSPKLSDAKYVSEMEHYPDLAESIDVSDDGKEAVVRIRNGIKFHDGSVMTSDDIIYSYKKWNEAQGKLRCTPPPIPGLKMERIDDLTVRFITSGPIEWKEFLIVLILNEDYEEEYKNSNEKYIPMGTGPFKFKEYDKREEFYKIFKLKSFEGFMNNPLPVRNMEFHQYDNMDSQLMDVLAENIDFAGKISPADVKDVKPNVLLKKLDVSSNMSNDIYGIVLNTQAPRLKDKRVRQAITLLIDRNTMVEDRYIKGVATDTVMNLSKPVNPPPVDPDGDFDKAIELLAEAGYGIENGIMSKNGEPLTLEILFPGYEDTYMRAAQYAVRNLYHAKIRAYFKIRDWEEIYKAMESGEFSAVFTRRLDMASLAQNYIFYKTNGRDNFGKFSSSEIDYAFDGLLTGSIEPTMDFKEELQKKIKEESPFVPMYYHYIDSAINIKFKDNKPLLDDPFDLYWYTRMKS